jgi:hypothetical protein
VLRPLHVFRFSLQTRRKREWRDPDSNRGHDDFQMQNPLGMRKSPMRYSRKLWIEDFLKDVVYLPFE